MNPLPGKTEKETKAIIREKKKMLKNRGWDKVDFIRLVNGKLLFECVEKKGYDRLSYTDTGEVIVDPSEMK